MGEPGHVRDTRDGYDSVATEYAERFSDSLRDHPFDRAMLAVFAELVRASGPLRVLDIGCGPGYVTDHLRTLGLQSQGIDLSPEMIALARRAYPDLRFELGDMTAIDLPNAGLGGVFSRSSIIHTPPEQLPAVFAEFHRVLAPGAHLLLTFQASDDTSQVAWPFDHAVALAYRLSVGRVADLLREAGFQEMARQITAPEQDKVRGFHYGYLLARRSADDANGAAPRNDHRLGSHISSERRA
ncbi:class I SAM-dependent methyltransferase [Nocardia sp. NBC_00565]|uniref:class I SAM-dependent DNA methyltransferase n=1 Tax=Nocardia sp. NBC_00565 TaxID=2975993 RepID=UPI002E7FD49C|nr:class I SAM-dependent methyltransferase [Nocardia sp. NBC_00565]WUC01116.1 class I SAM-dependent methyltransferase [Nocardia sp. NBC_00565]